MGKGASRLAASSTRRRSSVNTDALELSPDEAKAKVLHLQRKLHKWASTDKHKRFCDLWNLVCDPAVLQTAWLRVRSNKGSRTAGVDGATRYYVENRYGVERFLFELRQELNDRSYRPLPVRERGIPKKRGQVRYLGIPALRDRVVQMALKLVLEPILESDFHASSYGYRPGRRTQDAIAEIVLLANHPASYEWVIEADVEACFDVCLYHPLVRSRVIGEEDNLCDCVLGPSPRSIAVGRGVKVALQNRLQHQLQRHLHDPVSQGGNPEIANLSAFLRDAPLPYGKRSIAAVVELLAELND